LVSLAQLYAARNDTAKAFGLAKSARDLAPDDPRIAHILGHLAYEMHDYRWAVSLLKEAADRLPNDPEAQYDLARADYSVGRVAEAKAAMQAVLKIDARYARAGEAKSFLDLVEAAAHPSQAEASRVEGILGRNPGDVPALMAMGAIDEQGGRSLAARRLYEKALALYPDFSPAQRSFVIISAETPGDDRKAFEMGTKARESFPGDSRLARAYGIIGYRQGDYRTAVSALEEGARQVGDDGELVFYLGMAQYRLKQRSSRATLERAISLNLRPDLAAEARRTLAELK
jgi:predicted Zn-dependent protease